MVEAVLVEEEGFPEEKETSGEEKKEMPKGLFKVLSHQIRVRTIRALYENIELSYSEILSILKIDAGQLNFHLKNMQGLYSKIESGNYVLTEKGKFAYHMIEEVAKFEGDEEARAIEFPATILKRALATIIDTSLFVGAPLMVVSSISLLFPFHPETGTLPLLLTVFLMLLMFLSLIVHVAMEASTGQTIGKYAMNIRAVKESGRKLDLAESTIRNVGKIYVLPFDLLIGLLFYYRKTGYVRFTCYFTKSKVIDIGKIDLENTMA
jgi:uncharacterized RDD family membrane protein YckC